MSDYWEKQHGSEVEFVRKAAKKSFGKVRGAGKTVLQMHKDEEISDEEFTRILDFMERNGYPIEQVYDLPYSYIKRILG